MWNFIEINHEKYLIKFKQNGTYIECVLTNFRVAWHEQLTIDTLLNRGKVSYNSISCLFMFIIILSNKDHIRINYSNSINF